jgi:hypothetical protein
MMLQALYVALQSMEPTYYRTTQGNTSSHNVFLSILCNEYLEQAVHFLGGVGNRAAPVIWLWQYNAA